MGHLLVNNGHGWDALRTPLGGTKVGIGVELLFIVGDPGRLATLIGGDSWWRMAVVRCDFRRVQTIDFGQGCGGCSEVAIMLKQGIGAKRRIGGIRLKGLRVGAEYVETLS